MRAVFFRVKTMSENGQNGNNQTEDVETWKAKIAELEARIKELEEENQKLREALEKGVEALETEIDEQKAVAIKTITKISTMLSHPPNQNA